MRLSSRWHERDVTGIYPAKEGLKRIVIANNTYAMSGYRHLSSKRRIETHTCHLSTDWIWGLPAFIQQKKDWNSLHCGRWRRNAWLPAFIQQKKDWNLNILKELVSEYTVTGIYPAKEGLKRSKFPVDTIHFWSYRHLSSKRRIETSPTKTRSWLDGELPAFIQQKKDWNINPTHIALLDIFVTGIYPAKEGLKRQCCRM